MYIFRLLLFFLFKFEQVLQILLLFKQVHIVYLGERQHDDPKQVTDSHHDLLATVVGRYILYSYKIMCLISYKLIMNLSLVRVSW